MAGVNKANFESPDEMRTLDKTSVAVVKVGDVTIDRATLEPGWRWSEHVKAKAGTESCQFRHVGYVISGSVHVQHDDGSEADASAGEVYVIQPGHDAWVTSDEAFVGLEFESKTAAEYAAD